MLEHEFQHNLCKHCRDKTWDWPFPVVGYESVSWLPVPTAVSRLEKRQRKKIIDTLCTKTPAYTGTAEMVPGCLEHIIDWYFLDGYNKRTLEVVDVSMMDICTIQRAAMFWIHFITNPNCSQSCSTLYPILLPVISGFISTPRCTCNNPVVRWWAVQQPKSVFKK